MYRRCSREKVAFAFTLGCLYLSLCGCDGYILSKSKITLCVKDRQRDPVNVVAGKQCEKKLVITKAVTAGEKATEMIYVNISKVNDEVDHDKARLYNPFIITITKSPLQLIYPYYLEGTVNNKPFETTKREFFCHDGGDEIDDDDLSCPVLHDKTTGERVWDSQGFCCRCSIEENEAREADRNRYHRGNTVCGGILKLWFIFGKNKKRDSAHCMHYDKLWYNYHSIGGYRLLFKVFVKAYDLVEEEKDGMPHQRLVEGGQITLSNFKKSGYGIHGRILATLNGNFVPLRQFSSLKDKNYLLIPASSSQVLWDSHPQTKNGPMDYLIVPAELVADKTQISSCDKIGVSFTAFRAQGGHDGQGTGCTSKLGTCLSNQIKDLFDEDMRRRDAGKTPLYFPERRGKILGTQRYGKSERFALVYAVTQVITSMVTLEISADDIILIYNKATGIIVKAFATDFASLSQDGLLNVIVQNTGFVSADFYVIVSFCTIGILQGLEMKAAINPQTSHVISMELRTTVHVSAKHTCTVNLLDARHGFLDSANVSFGTTKSCVCLQSCSCACTGDAESNRCILKGYVSSKEMASFDNVKFTKRTIGTLEGFFWSLNNNLAIFVDHFTKPTLRRFLTVWLCLSLLFGWFKARLGNLSGGAPIAYFGWWWPQPEGRELVVDARGEQVMGTYNDDGELINPQTGEVLKSEKLLLFVCNLFFFVLIICVLGVHASRYYKRLRGGNEVLISLSSVALARSTVYRNFTELPDAEKYFKNPGTNFSVAGKLQRMKRGYNFIVVDNMQIVEVGEDTFTFLDPPFQFDTSAFTRSFNVKEALDEITLQPLYVCLNEEPSILDFYSDDEQPILGDSASDEESSSPPTPPIPDYPLYDLTSPTNISDYEKPSLVEKKM